MLGAGAFAIVVVAPPQGLARPFVELGQGVLPAGVLGLMAIVVSVGLVILGARLAPSLTRLDRRALTVGFLAGIVGYLVLSLGADPSPATGQYRDAWTYFGLGIGDPYGLAYQQGGSGYPPPFLQAVGPLSAIGWAPFLALWTTVELLALLVVAGPLAALVLLVPFVALEAWNGNVNLLIALAIAWGFRWPALWSFILVTKITPGVGLLWFAVRREWRRLATAIAVTAVIVAVSLAIDPGMWRRFIDAEITSSTGSSEPILLPLLARVGLAAVVVVIGALRDKPWTVPLAAAIAMPFLWLAACSALVAMVPLTRAARAADAPASQPRRRAVDWALSGPARPDAVA